MSTTEWALVVSLVAQFAVLLSMLRSTKNEIYAWVRDVFALKADLAVLEEQVKNIRNDTQETKEMVKRILEKLDSK